MGGMQALQWVASYPDRVRSAIPIATTLKHSPQQIAFDEVGRQAVMADPDWREGELLRPRAARNEGLAVARMIGHITYMSDQSMEEKFSRRLKDEEYSFSLRRRISRWRGTCGTGGTASSSASTPTPTSTSPRRWTISTCRSGRLLSAMPGSVEARFLVIAFQSDWLYPPYQSREIVRRLKMRGVDATYCEIKSTYGHDAFLLEIEEQIPSDPALPGQDASLDREGAMSP